jgi:tetratricopeptide (TPR) repeat protein
MAETTADLLHRIARAFDSGDLALADELCTRILTVNGASVPAWIVRARIRMRQGMFGESEAALERAEAIDADEPEVPLALAMLRVRQGRYAEALPLLDRAQRGVDDERVSSARANCLIATGDAKGALRLLGTPTTAEGRLTAGKAAVKMDPALAETHLREAIRIGENAAAVQQAHQLLARIAEERDDLAGSFEHLAAAKMLTSTAFDPNSARISVGALMDVFTATFLRRSPHIGVDTARPVFIVGMPRSGTTLLEKMIASHPRGAGAGETTALFDQIRVLAAAPDPKRRWPYVVTAFRAGDFMSIARSKHLQNWFAVGLMALAFPQATIVHIRRDPFDTGLSCYERLQPGVMAWTRNLRNVGIVLALNERLMNHWHAVLPNRLIPVQYEQLARQPAATLAPILAAAGLEWDDACIRPHERQRRPGNQEPPPTLSVDQVQRPIYDTSIGRAERYGALLDPMRQAYAAERAGFG